MKHARLIAGVCAALCLAAPARAQPTNVDNVFKYAWGENVGWFNFADAVTAAGADGVRFYQRFLAGFAWGENVGWVNFGDGSPRNGVQYTQAVFAGPAELDFGVNVDSMTGAISGFAWGENVGWINFNMGWPGGFPAAQLPRLEPAIPPSPPPPVGPRPPLRVRGYAWAENLGWINFDLNVQDQYVGIYGQCSIADICGIGGPPIPPDGLITGDDFNAFIAAFAAGDELSDITGIGGPPAVPDGLITGDDFNAFIAAFAAGC